MVGEKGSSCLPAFLPSCLPATPSESRNDQRGGARSGHEGPRRTGRRAWVRGPPRNNCSQLSSLLRRRLRGCSVAQHTESTPHATCTGGHELLCSLFSRRPMASPFLPSTPALPSRDCNIGQRLHSCFKLDLLKSFRRAMPTRANWDGKYIFSLLSRTPTYAHRARSPACARTLAGGSGCEERALRVEARALGIFKRINWSNYIARYYRCEVVTYMSNFFSNETNGMTLSSVAYAGYCQRCSLSV